MHSIQVMRILIALAICQGAIAPAVRGEEPPSAPAAPAAPAESEDSLRRARELIKQAEYEEAIQLLREEIERSRGNMADLRDSYLLLIETYTIRGNSYRFSEPATAELYHKEARATIRECLEIPALRHTKPEPVSDFTPETIAAFDQVRSEVFGSFLIRKLTPSDALVVFGADTLSARPDGLIVEDDILVGNHLLVLRQEGFRSMTEEIVISPGATVDRSYELEAERPWYKRAWVYALVAGGVGTAVWAATNGDESAGEPEPLAGPPPPPGK